MLATTFTPGFITATGALIKPITAAPSNYTCSPTVCTGTGNMVDVFKQLQTLLNAAMTKLGSSIVLPIDGQLDQRAAAAVAFLSQKATQFAVFDQTINPAFVAASAGSYVQSLAQWLSIPVPTIALCPAGQTLTPQGCIPDCPAGTVRTASGCTTNVLPIKSTGPKYPSGTITAYSSKRGQWRVAIPIGTTIAGFGAAATYQETTSTATAPTMTDPTTGVATTPVLQTTEADLEAKTGQTPFYKKSVFWAIAAGVVVVGGGVLWRRRTKR